jgi:glycosyltransferase involved in cell wall biosynthesis
VPVEELLAYTREADVGVSLLSDDCENHRLALPNKVFEYIAANVPVVVSDLPELRRLVVEYGVGRTADASNAPALAEALAETLGEKGERREALVRAADALSWKRESDRLVDLYKRLDGERRPRALVFVRNAVTYDARVLREGRLLQELGFATTVVGSVSTTERAREAMISGVPIRRLAVGSLPWRGRRAGSGPASATAKLNGGPPRSRRGSPGRRLLLAMDWYRRGIAQVVRARPALVHCNDYNTMWIGVAAKLAGARVVYDSHELWPDRNLRPEPRLWLMTCEALFARVADQVITTSPAYAAVLSRRYWIPEPLVVRNVPDAPPFPASRTERSEGVATAVYIGAVTPGRGLEIAVRALTRLPAVRLRIVGPDMRGYSRRLLDVASEAGVLDRVELCPPVPPDRVVGEAARADVGLALIEPACLSYTLTLPNKLFEYMAAGVPVVASSLPAMAQILDSTGAGATADPLDERHVADRIAGVLDPVENQRLRAAARAAAAKLTWASESATLAGVYRAA